jgi:anti-sigma regulatory factor (Ser/Thr protein kinase)
MSKMLLYRRISSSASRKGELLVSELVTNALVHGTEAGQKIWVGFRVERDFLHIAVDDPSSEKPIPRQLSGDRETGRGLLMVEALAAEWGCGPREGVGKRVWARLAPAAADAEAATAT